MFLDIQPVDFTCLSDDGGDADNGDGKGGDGGGKRQRFTASFARQEIREQAALIADLRQQVRGLVSVLASQANAEGERVASATAKAISLLVMVGFQGGLAISRNKVSKLCNKINNLHT